MRSVDGIQVGEGRCGPVTKRIQQAFLGLFTGETEDKWGWLIKLINKYKKWDSAPSHLRDRHWE
ncbi:hypothetical protein ACLB1E_05445 [Escherichia coli]